MIKDNSEKKKSPIKLVWMSDDGWKIVVYDRNDNAGNRKNYLTL